MHSVTQISCLSGDQRVRRKFFVNQCYLWCGHKSYRRSLHWANTHSLTGDLEEYFPGEKTGLRKIDSSFFWFFFLHYASMPSMGLGAHWKMNSDHPYLTGSETCRLFRCSTSRKFNKLCQKDMSIDWKFTDVYVFFFFFPIAPPSFFFSPFHCPFHCVSAHIQSTHELVGPGQMQAFSPQLLEGSVTPPTVILHSYLPPQPNWGGSAQCLHLTSRCRLI